MSLKTIKIVIIAIIILFTNSINAQKYELGEVTLEELKETHHPIDSSASAAIIFKKGVTQFNLNQNGDWTVVTEVKFKIKIYKKEGLDYANKSISYYVKGNSGNEVVSFKNAITYNIVDGKIEKTKLKSEGEFTEDYNKNYKLKKITMPQVKEGSIVEYSYKISSPYITTFNDWYFQGDIPVNYVEYNVVIPEYFKYRTVISGYEKIDLSETVVPANSFSQLKTTYIAKNIPALKEEGFIINMDNYTSILKHELASINYPNQFPKNLAITWDDVVKSIYDHEGFGSELENKSYFEDDLRIVLKGLTSDKERIDAIFNFVKNKITWDETNGVITDKGVKNAYKEGIGNVSEINLMLIAMLRYAGIDANPVLLSTRKNGIALFPNRTAYNYVVAGIEVQDDVLLLDATSKNALVDLMPLRAVNWSGRIIRERGSSNEISLLDVPVSIDNVTVLGQINEDGVIEGKLRRVMTEYNSFVHRENFAYVTEDSYLEKLENKYENITIEDYKVENMKNLNKPVTEFYSFVRNNDAEIIGDKMYIKPLMFFTMENNPFKLDQRKYPIDFSYPFKDVYNISFKIPDGYEVEYLPESKNIIMENNYANFKYLISVSNNSIQLIVNLDVNNFYIPADRYATLKDFFKMLIEKQTDRIILKKKI